MQFKVFFLLCALQAVQFASAQCGHGPIVAPALGCDHGYLAGNGAYNNGNFAVAGILAVNGYNSYNGVHGNQFGYSGVNDCHTGYHGLATPVYTSGDIEAAGTLPVSGPVAVDGRVPVEGSVNYSGDVSATGVACAACSCGNNWI